ncbi:hypothetical protein CP967_12305 [Streptomyces nitrosporeus]|uniref:GerMN domain-containing protein n=1 Tax=Streptomyces nitrosporeus TaxID=28894 RepID=A0A5J6FJK8_9ACTN|nr:hypothetical protein CP967_12305 [Streptomyces nitrosporeus]
MRGERPYGGRGGRAAAVLAAVAATAALAAGCGIRSTTVPVDAGPAPSRVPCRTTDADAPADAGTPTVRIYLVCASQLVTVDRAVEAGEPGTGRVDVARSLLTQLQQSPSADERHAGLATLVPAGLRVGEARSGDPRRSLRLSEQPEDLSAEALAQLVCTYAESEAVGSGHSVLLGGPGDYAPRDYLCTSATKRRPTEVPTLRATP